MCIVDMIITQNVKNMDRQDDFQNEFCFVCVCVIFGTCVYVKWEIRAVPMCTTYYFLNQENKQIQKMIEKK